MESFDNVYGLKSIDGSIPSETKEAVSSINTNVTPQMYHRETQAGKNTSYPLNSSEKPACKLAPTGVDIRSDNPMPSCLRCREIRQGAYYSAMKLKAERSLVEPFVQCLRGLHSKKSLQHTSLAQSGQSNRTKQANHGNMNMSMLCSGSAVQTRQGVYRQVSLTRSCRFMAQGTFLYHYQPPHIVQPPAPIIIIGE